MNKITTEPLEADPRTVQEWLREDRAVLVDVRETSEYEQEHIPGALLVPLSCFEADLFPSLEHKTLVLHCAIGKRSAAAAKQLAQSGYGQPIVNMAGGINGWKDAGLPTEVMHEAEEDEPKCPPASPHPGSVLEGEFLTPLGLGQSHLARRLGISPRRVNEIVRGRRALTPDTALRLARYFSTTPDFWLRLQMEHDLAKTCARSGRAIEQEVQPRHIRKIAAPAG